jgi:hypothetical protein
MPRFTLHAVPHVTPGGRRSEQQQSAVHVKNAAYLSQRLCYTPDGTKLLDADGAPGGPRKQYACTTCSPGSFAACR